MVDLVEKRLTVDEFLVWADGREGNWELVDGSPTAMSPERVRHTQTKTEAAFALREAARRAGASCRGFVAGITLRIRDDRAFVPRRGRRVSAAAARCGCDRQSADRRRGSIAVYGGARSRRQVRELFLAREPR
jgi:hypothetical protein